MLERMVVTRGELFDRIASGAIDTVIMGFPDRYGRLVGKRAAGRFFVDEVADHGTENCDYLLTCDLDDRPEDGFRFSSFDTGYGDMLAVADWSTVRVVPWLDRTALVICDLRGSTGHDVEIAPRSILRAQVDAAARTGLVPMMGSEIEFFLYHESYTEAHGKNYADLHTHSPWAEDYNIHITSRDEVVIGDIRRSLEAAGVPIEFSKGEAGAGQHEINIGYSDALEMADRNLVYKFAAKEIAARHGRSITFMAKPSFSDVGSSCHVHLSMWDVERRVNRFADESDRHGMSSLFRHFLAGQIATAREFSLLWAPTVNSYKRFQPESWAPTGVGWGVDNRTLGFRKVGHGPSTRVENRIPGADAVSYLAFAGAIAGGLYGVRHSLELSDPYVGNGYVASDIERIPWTLPDAIDAWRTSERARECFGDDVHHWILRCAETEWAAFNRSVTDWEMRRYFERI
ncbi:MAG: glutamine synthetase family protein [Ilumatobacteraceae bacterium]